MKTERKRWSRNTEYHLKKDSVNALFTKKMNLKLKMQFLPFFDYNEKSKIQSKFKVISSNFEFFSNSLDTSLVSS